MNYLTRSNQSDGWINFDAVDAEDAAIEHAIHHGLSEGPATMTVEIEGEGVFKCRTSTEYFAERIEP